MNLQQIQEAFKVHPGNIYGAAAHLGVSPHTLIVAMRKIERRTENGVNYIVPVFWPPDDLGRPNLRKHIISVRRSGEEGWPIQDMEAIEKARVAYDHGLVDMFQKHERGWVILYSRPRRKKDYNRRPWFSVVPVGGIR